MLLNTHVHTFVIWSRIYRLKSKQQSNLGVRFNLLETYFDVHSLNFAAEFQ